MSAPSATPKKYSKANYKEANCNGNSNDGCNGQRIAVRMADMYISELILTRMKYFFTGVRMRVVSQMMLVSLLAMPLCWPRC
jgi:hypothetical protein